jgi:hypothetical protein
MDRRTPSAGAVAVVALGLGSLVASVGWAAEPAKDAKPPAAGAAGQPPEMKLPPGWTMEDMQAYAAAATPGKMHERLMKEVGEWHGKSTFWMAPGGGEPIRSECTYTVKSMLDGRYTQAVMAGDMPGMGPYNGFALTGFDNVSQKFVCTWIDSQSTGMMNGTGELSADGKTTTWTYNFHCPITKKPALMRQVETITGADRKTLEMWGPDPKSGKEFKMMRVEFTKKK